MGDGRGEGREEGKGEEGEGRGGGEGRGRGGRKGEWRGGKVRERVLLRSCRSGAGVRTCAMRASLKHDLQQLDCLLLVSRSTGCHYHKQKWSYGHHLFPLTVIQSTD